jgi:hypothetical protein
MTHNKLRRRPRTLSKYPIPTISVIVRICIPESRQKPVAIIKVCRLV